MFSCQISEALNESPREKNQQYGFRMGLTQTELYKHRSRLEAYNTIPVAKMKALISFEVTAKLICAFGFAYADCWFSDVAAQIVFARSSLQ